MLDRINGFVWGAPVLLLLFSAGIWVSFRLRFPQITLFAASCRELFRQLSSRDSSSFRALCTALAATVGTGNIAAVAGAIAIGGPGAIFWMWISGFFGMALKYCEAVLAVQFCRDGKGGTMYVIEHGLGRRYRPLAIAYCIFGVFAGLGVGSATQISSVLEALSAAVTQGGGLLSPWVKPAVAAGLAILTWQLTCGGAGRIGNVAELVVPFASLAYIALCAAVIIPRLGMLPEVLATIVKGAFSPRSVTGGAVGSLLTCMRIGVSRGTFSNEAGMGTATVAHAEAKVVEPVRQGMMGIMEVFIDTIVICSLTALTILLSGIPIPYGQGCGAELTAQALSKGFGAGASWLLFGCLLCFSMATVIGWGLYAGRFLEYLLDRIQWKLFAVCQSAVVFLAGILKADSIWAFSELMNALMVVPNLIALVLLLRSVRQLTHSFLHRIN